MNDTSFDRSWLTSGLSRPPAFGESLPATWLKFCVSFRRGGAVKDGHGGTMAAEPVEYLRAWCHVVTEKVRIVSSTEGVQAYKHQTNVRLPIPAVLPQPGDTFVWTDDLCREQRLFVRNVVSPLSLGDHILCESELYD